MVSLYHKGAYTIMGDNRWLKNSFVYLIILVAALALFFNYFNSSQNPEEENGIAQVIADARAGNIATIEATQGNSELIVTLNGGESYSSRLETGDTVMQLLVDSGVVPGENSDIAVTVEPAPAWGGLLNVFSILLPVLIMIGFFVFFMRQAQGSNNQALSFGKSRARMFSGDKPTVTFADVAGQEEAKQDLTEVVEFLKFPDKFAALGARIPRGVLMVGPPGTGKTLLSRAVAGEAGVPFFSISGSEFVEMFVGVGASRVRDLFDQAKRNAPCIIFIDEIDAVGRQRGAGLGGSHDEREQTLNQILVEMDGFDTNTNVIIIAATNRPDVLDPALIRPGRFDRQVVLDAPDVRGRTEVLKVHTKGKPLSEDVDLEIIAKQTPGFSGADLANVINEGAILAARRAKKKISLSELQDAVERVALGGPERRSRVMSEREKMLVAYHESGHALVSAGMPGSSVVQKVTIVPRGRAGGYTLYLLEEDRLRFTSMSQFEAQLVSALGGRVAEELVFGQNEVTTGASGDIDQVTRIARSMVTRYGMSPLLGPISFGEKDELVFLGREISEQRNYSDEVANKIDTEVYRIVAEAYERAKEVLMVNRTILNDMASALIEYETLEGDRLRELLNRVTKLHIEEPQPHINGNGATASVDALGTNPTQDQI
ncbi:MAG: ATP-dependent metallopeptidase FtsH/Yme1/Tma family protein [Chloroflexi bacterium AL-W]|nr:ATP-dependent metallopeptidase FtsH/Yme1/Tma family protein [Chloroflexi bacterium AL-N1]NOK66264.1 ATP-dependent metallopeptidase FtsH/Yme1/Tma family protein [Chloroflexi bacterium AL-N10]NOK73144.1 ATP-dependent metallopeptidase FtsH/Yme1/Tma family protein [Chloroflexi bacterium AL-N5]NOK80041.1 ATP-dependent metallopeptidase FtsH/Yme1/Tma family protein [Chloroflexi bacterium AL-W]NOK88103.1 ATP-dependent metallopeptidase FtsH/Yme1/Tma family protein [Chloroflexi bacterium AL-N15]